MASPTGSTYVISTDCMRCGVCEFMCAQAAIIEAKRQFVILKHLCTGCGDCVAYCPAEAIVPADQFRERERTTVSAQLGTVLTGRRRGDENGG